jgi:hypothetical protein
MARQLKFKTRKDSRLELDHEAIPPRKKRILAIILKENKSCAYKWVSYRKDSFRVDEHTYFIVPKGQFLSSNRVLCSVYLEGVSTPFTHANVVKKQEKRSFIDTAGRIKKVMVTVIKGLKYDSQLIDMLLNRKLADEFTKVHLDLPNLITLILLIAILVTGIISIGIQLQVGGFV